MALQKEEFDRFMSQARVKLTGASDGGIKLELFDVLKEFFEDSNSWTETIDVPITLGVQDYKLVPRYGGRIIRLNAVWDYHKFPIVAFMPHFGTLHLRWPPSNPGTQNTPFTYHAGVVKNLTWQTDKDDVPIAPEWLLDVYGVTILDGLLGKMMTQENKSYTDQGQGKYHLQRFRTGIQQAKVAAQRQNTMGAQNWRFPGGWHCHTQRGGAVTAWPPETI
jgi:hypothetical protein